MWLTKVLTLIIIWQSAHVTTAFDPATVISTLKVTGEVISAISTAWEIADSVGLTEKLPSVGLTEELPSVDKAETQILARMAELTKMIKNAEIANEQAAQKTVQGIENFIQRNTKLQLVVHEMIDLVNRVDNIHDQFEQYVTHYDKLERSTLENFAKRVIDDSSLSVKGMLPRIQHLVAGPGGSELRVLGNDGLLELIATDMEEATMTYCASQRSPQQVLYQLYNAITITELKGYAMMQFSFMLLKTYGHGNYTQESLIMKGNFEKRVSNSQKITQKVLERADRTLWRCDPNSHVEGSTYLQITRLLQGYVENEVDMNKDESCTKECSDYQLTENHGCYNEMHCSHQPRCEGKIVNCTFVESSMKICPAQKNSNRRYEYIEYKNVIFGQNSTCSRDIQNIKSWPRFFVQCTYCFCICDDLGQKSDRFFNLRPVLSNINSNMVVTGIRFYKQNRVIHLQIQEGQLMERGEINSTSVRWVPVENYSTLDGSTRNGIDYHTLAYESRDIDLDDLTAPPGHVVTGVKFRVIGTHLNLEMRVSEINFSNGEIIKAEKDLWVFNDNTEQVGSNGNRRSEISLNAPEIPIYTKAKSMPISSSNTFVKFTYTDIEKDAAQTTVPFLDAQEVVNNPPVPLEGVGIFLKGQNGYGGFISPKIKTFDFSPFVQSIQAPQKS